MKEPQYADDFVPGRPSGAELRAMALRQQQQIESQQQLLAAKEQRLRFLKAQEVRGAAAAAEGERLRRLRERVEAQESKLRRLRALRGQVDLQKTYNVTLSNDLDSIRALFSEKEKELSLAVAKVEALTRQLEDVRRDRRAPLALIPGSGGVGSSGTGNAATTSPAALELDKLRRELMYRNQLSLQQDARLHLQREALQQRQAELRSVDQRILELQNRLHKKKAANVLHPLQTHGHSMGGHHQQTAYHQQQQQHLQLPPSQQQQMQQQLNNNIAIQLLGHNNQLPHKPSNSVYPSQRVIPRGNVAAVEPYMHTPQKPSLKSTQQQQQLQHHQQQQQQQTQHNSHLQQPLKKSLQPNNQLIHDLTNLKLNMQQSQSQQQHAHLHQQHHVQHVSTTTTTVAESDESKLAARQKHNPYPYTGHQNHHIRQGSKDSADSVDPKHQPQPYKYGLSKSASSGAIPSSSSASASPSLPYHLHQPTTAAAAKNESDTEKTNGGGVNSSSNSSNSSTSSADSDGSASRKAHRLPHSGGGTVHSTILSGASKSQAVPMSGQTTNAASAAHPQVPTQHSKPAIRPKAPVSASVHTSSASPSATLLHKLHPGNLAVPPRKPISSVAPTTIVTPPKIIAHSPKVHMVAPTSVTTSHTPIVSATSAAAAPPSIDRPALPPKPGKSSPTSAASQDDSTSSSTSSSNFSSVPTVVSVISKPPMSEPDAATTNAAQGHASVTDNLPIIKARPLTIKKQPLSEQPPKLRTGGVGGNSLATAAANAANNNNGTAVVTSATTMNGNGSKPIQYSRRIEMPPASLFPEIEKASLKAESDAMGTDDTDRSSVATSNNDDEVPQHSVVSGGGAHEVVRRQRSNLAMSGSGGKVKLARRVSFDPLALLLDASLEGELELVRKTTMQVPNPSAANDEGITALHNAICAGHFSIVKFLVEYGCDVNAQDSDGWTPLHCAASCNNLEMVKFLVESGACLFAATLSDHETPAEKCEEDEEGFDGCSEYLYSIQEKLGILNTGEVYAVFSYDSQQPDELNFGVNDRLVILRKGDDAEREWWWARLDNGAGGGHEGYVPRNLLGLYPRVLLQHSLD